MTAGTLKPGSITGSRGWDLTVVGLCAAVVILLLVWPTVQVALGGDQYVFLARRLAEGRLDVDNLSPRYGDYALWQGHKYLPFGPLPALLLIPLLPLLNAGMALVFVGYAFTAANVFILYRLLGVIGVANERRHWAALLYFAGTPYLGVTLIGISTYYAHVVATTFLLLAIHEALGKRRWLLVGVSLGLASACRFTEIFALPFFIWMAGAGAGGVNPGEEARRDLVEWRSAKPLSRFAMLFSGLAAPILLLCAYNYARFGNIAETGFGKAVLYNDVLYEARSAGLFSLAHIPKNLFMMLLQGPQPVGGDSTAVLRFPYVQPSQWGMGLFFTSPALLYVFRARLSEPLVKSCWIATLTMLVPILAYYGIGYLQFGYRYALDFMPFLIVLVARGLPDPMTNRARALVTASVLINVWGALMLAVRN